MSVRIRIPGIWRGLAEGEAEPQVAGDTVGDVLRALAARHPQMRERIFTGEGDIKPYLHVFLNRVEIRNLAGPGTVVADGDEILLLMALGGG